MSRTKLAAFLLSAFCLSAELRAQQSTNGSIGEVFATDASVTGSVILAAGGTRVASGSTVAAGRTTASLRLDRGGEVRVCPGTSVAVTASARSKGLMLSLSGGTVETHYSVGSSADTIQTPDFRILFPGPGDFHFAVRADASGNTCIRALDGNTASIVVSEVMGDGSYQVRPNEQVTFNDGKVSNAVPFGKCGCAPVRESLKADSAAPKPAAAYTINNATLASPIIVPAPEAKPAPAERKPEPSVATAAVPEAPPVTTVPTPEPSAAVAPSPAPTPKADEVHVQVDVPMVYSADAAAAATAVAAPVPPSPAPVYLPAAVYMALFRPVMDMPTVTPTPPPAKQAKEKKGFFGRLRSFFGGMFH